MEPGKQPAYNRTEQLLTSVKAGEFVCIAHVNAGRQLQARLISMGLTKGKCVTLLKNDSWGPLVLSMGDNRLTLGRGAARKIFVTPGTPSSYREKPENKQTP